MSSPFRRLGEVIVGARRWVVGLWVLLTLVGILGASQVRSVLTGDVTRTPGSESDQLSQLIHHHFDRQFPQTFLVTLTSDRYTVDDTPYQDALTGVQQALTDHPKVGSVFSYRDDQSLISDDRHHTFLLVGLRVDDFPESLKLVRPIGDLVHGVAVDPTIKLAVTGNAPISADMEQTASEDGARAELRVVPLAAIVMVVLFGALVAALVPVSIGLVACTMAFASLWVIGHWLELNAFVQNFVTMIGLGVGIDYSLFIVSRFREELKAGHDQLEAAIRATETAGQSITYSGIAVSIGTLALLIPDLPLTRALGLSGMTVVSWTVILSLTLLPAVLALLGERINSPRAFNRLITRYSRSRQFWGRWSRRVMARPVAYLALSLAILGGLSALAFDLKTWNSNILLMPEHLESRQGFEVLTKTAGERQISPIGVAIGLTDGSTIYQPDNLKAVYDFSKGMQERLPLGRVLSIVDLNPNLTLDDYQALMQNMLTLRILSPTASNPLLSTDDQMTLMWVTPRAGTTDNDHWELTEQMRAYRAEFMAQHPQLAITIGGGAAAGLDFSEAVRKDFPTVILATILTTFLVIMLSFRSILLALKSVVANALSVSASIGFLVAVFQYGWGARLFGIDTPPGALMHITPLALFCIIFGLSMDYQIFLMSRVKENWDETADAKGCVTTGLEQTGGIITSAAVIMIIVFAGFTFAETILVKELGLGLAVAIALDVTVIRLLLVPSFMALVGKACWWFPPVLKRLLPELNLRH